MQTRAFLARVGLGHKAARPDLFAPFQNAVPTGFVVHFELSALPPRCAAQLSLDAIRDWTLVALLRDCDMAAAAVDAQCAAICNLGVLGIPQPVLRPGEGAAGPALLVPSVDPIVFPVSSSPGSGWIATAARR